MCNPFTNPKDKSGKSTEYIILYTASQKLGTLFHLLFIQNYYITDSHWRHWTMTELFCVHFWWNYVVKKKENIFSKKATF